MHSQKDNINVKIITIITIIIITSLLWLLAGYFGFFIPTDEPNETWFQRSGAIVCFSMIVAEIGYQKLSTFYNTSISLAQKNKFSYNIYKVLQPIIGIVAIIGTAVWGYGDLMYLGKI